MSDDDAVNMCVAQVNYKDRQGPCQRMGKYQDADGERWWCGLHNPERRPKVTLASDYVAPPPTVIDREVLVGVPDPDDSKEDEMLDAMEAVRRVLVEISNIRTMGWPDNTPVEKYKIIMTHIADMALEASAKLAEKILQFRS